jgi:uncharacterized membrane protein
VVVIVFSIPLILERVPPNDLYGYRTREVLSSPELWYDVNRFLGWAMLVAGAAGAALGGFAIASRHGIVAGVGVLEQSGFCVAALLVTWCYRQIAKQSAGQRPTRAPRLDWLNAWLTWLVPVSGIGLALPLLFRAIPPNGVYGYRTAYSMSSEPIWYRANHALGWALLVAGLAGVALAAWVAPQRRRDVRRRAVLLQVFLFLVAAAAVWGYVQGF